MRILNGKHYVITKIMVSIMTIIDDIKSREYKSKLTPCSSNIPSTPKIDIVIPNPMPRHPIALRQLRVLNSVLVIDNFSLVN